MSDVVAVPEAIQAYAEAAAAMAVSVAAAGATNQAATVGAAVPVFGLIGQDFLAAFAGAQASNLMSVCELAAVHAATAKAALESAATYELTEAAAVTEFGIIGNQA